MAVRPGKNKPVVSKTGKVLPRNKVFLIIGRGIALKGKVKRGGS